MKRTALTLVMTLFALTAFAAGEGGVWDVTDFGAVGDGKSLCTEAIQTAIDHCHDDGGGTVLIRGGKFLSGSLYLLSNVSLEVAPGAVLIASSDPKDVTASGLIYAQQATNITVCGRGTIQGRPDKAWKKGDPRYNLICFKECKDVVIKDILLYKSTSWVQKYELCEKVLIQGVRVESRNNVDIEKPRYNDVQDLNGDGCDFVDSKNIRVSDCAINSEDDAIVFKSYRRDVGCQDVVVNNCVITSNASGIKIGTESAGNFTDFSISNCTLYNIRGAGVGLMTVDGAQIERVAVSNITMRKVKGAAIFVRVGNRDRYTSETVPYAASGLRDVSFSHIIATDLDRYGCSITGLKDLRPQNVVLEDINLTFKGGDSSFYFEGYEHMPVQTLTMDTVPEKEKDYPRSDTFGKFPAYGFYIRHADGVWFRDIRLRFKDVERRPAIAADDVSDMFIDNLWAQGTVETPSVLHLRDVRGARVSNSGTFDKVPAFVKYSGTPCKDVKIQNCKVGK